MLDTNLMNLHLDATFGKRNQSLTIITILVDVLGLECKDDKCLLRSLV
jgi:hypothetical protein